MSHFSQMQTKFNESIYLKKALLNMGFQTEENPNGVDVRGFFGESTKAEFKILTKTHYDIGFIKNESGTYEVVGDWELLPQVSQIEKEPFMAALKKEYAKVTILETAKANGYEVSTQENTETGEIEMVVTQWA